MDTKTLNQWLREYGYAWVAGQEQMHKAMITKPNALIQIQQLLDSGAIKRA